MASPPFRANLVWAAPYREWWSHFHHSMALESQLNILKESVGLVISRPRHFWDCKWKSRCWDTHFHNMTSVSSQSSATIQSFSGLMHLPVFPWTMVNGSLPELRQTVKLTFQDCELWLWPLPAEGSMSTTVLFPPSQLCELECTTPGQQTVVARGQSSMALKLGLWSPSACSVCLYYLLAMWSGQVI